jgi:Xaa-Pro dipeptidase
MAAPDGGAERRAGEPREVAAAPGSPEAPSSVAPAGQPGAADAQESPYPHFSEAEHRRRRGQIEGLMAERGVDLLLVAGGPGSADVHYLTDYMPRSPAWVLLPRGGEPTVLHHFHNHNAAARAAARAADVRWYGPSAPRGVAEAVRRLGLERSVTGIVGLGGAIAHNRFLTLREALPEVRFVDLEGPYHRLRWIRSAEELEWIRRSAHLTDLACVALEEGIRPGLSEHDLSLLLHRAFVPLGGQLGLQFMASTPMEAPSRFVPWQFPTGRVLQRGDVVITELTVGWWTYAAQIHRPFAVAAQPTALYRRLFDVALECYERVVAVLRPGARSEDVVAASAIIEESGFTSCDSLLHGEAGKNPELGSRSAVHPLEPFTFEEGMVVVVQPNPVAPPEGAGLQLGAAVVIRSGGAECLHRYPFHFPVCG